MDFDDAKENIQPLACGRNVHMLHASLRTDTHELVEQRKRLEQEIIDYKGDDPLDPWFHYIDWIEQSCPSGGKESGLQEVLVKCLTRFEKETKYYQDERMVKLYIKFISSLKEPLEKYEALYKAGIGTMVADFYISWAYVADFCGNSRKADEIFVHGKRCHAKPEDVLEEAHTHFRFYVGQRLMYKDDEEVLDEANRQLSERRLALASLRRRGKKAAVGSIRTGAALKSHIPGVVPTLSSSSANLTTANKVYLDENQDANSIRAVPAVVELENTSAVRMLIDAARNQENEREPGPWDKAHNKKQGKLFARSGKQTNLEFEIHEDSISETRLPKLPIPAFKYPLNFVAKNQPQAAWIVPITTEEQAESCLLPEYNKCFIYPRPNKEFQLEELFLYNRYKRQGISNSFTAAHDIFWSKGDVQAPLRQYPNFAKKNLPQKLDALDSFYQPTNLEGLEICAKKLYNEELQQEFQLEEIMWQKRQERMMNTQYSDDAMEETMCANSERVKQRKSFFPAQNRKSIYPTLKTAASPQPSNILAELLQNTTLEEKLPEIVSVAEKQEKFMPFEIYEDTTQPKILVQTSKHNDTPRFIAPAQVDVENIDPTPFTFKEPLPPPPIMLNDNDNPPPQVGYYDGEETCCTQQFNILLKSGDKMSTPVVHKVNPRVIKEVQEIEEKITSPESCTKLPETSPEVYFKNLSTILETSEHASTAASRTTTKSSCASNNELESTPAAPRLQSKIKSNIEEVVKVGNFTRLEERENTAQLGGFLSEVVRFQEDKTETLTNKILINDEQKITKFQEDKTDTFSKLLKPLKTNNAFGGFQEDKTDTFSKLLPPPMLPMEQTPMKMPINSPTKGNLNSTANLLIPNTPPNLSTTPAFKFRDSFVKETRNENANDSFIPTLAQTAGSNSFWKPDFMQQNESILGNLSMAERWSQNSPQKTKEVDLQKSTQNKHMLPDSFLKDFHMPPPVSMENKLQFSNTSKLKFLNDSTAKTTPPQIQQVNNSKGFIKSDLLSFSNTSTLKFLDDVQKDREQEKSEGKLTKSNFFEGNMETAQFNINNSMIKNSTCLMPNLELVESAENIDLQSQEFLKEQSLHIKQEPLEDKSEQEEMSIYYKKTPRTPRETRHAWINEVKTPNVNDYVVPVINLDVTHHDIQTQCADQLVNPFSDKLRSDFLNDIAFTEYIRSLNTCQLKGHVSRLQTKQQIEIQNQKFEIIKIIGEGGFGTVYQGKHLPKGTKVALKQEQPPKLWEYYICLEIQSRIQVDDMLAAYMSIDWALIGTNSSILVYGFSTHGSLIQVCNKVKKINNQHLDEFVVMFLVREILEIIDHLHSINIIHADLKPDNILLINFLNYKNETRSLQLIDFGESIDMRLFQNPQQQFKYVYNNDQLKCVEMREGRFWNYHLDLFGVCGVIHALLFGKYMEIEKRSNGIWMPKIRMPRYFHKDLWENIFETLLNVKESSSLPDLQTLRKELKEVLEENLHQVLQKISEFNFHLRC